MLQPNQLSGILLAGGKSSRMGKNKALLKWDGEPMATYLAGVLQSLCSALFISGDPEILAELPGKKIPDSISVLGPMTGIFSCLQKIQTPMALVLPCDMPFVDASVLKHLLSNWKDSDAILCFSSQGKMQPLVGIYRKELEGSIGAFLISGESRAWKIVESLGGRTIEFPQHPQSLAGEAELNVNSPSQYFHAVNKKNHMIRLLFFGSLADKAGTKELNIPLQKDLDALRAQLQIEMPALNLNAVLISVNQNLQRENTALKAGDEIAFMPPFAGG